MTKTTGSGNDSGDPGARDLCLLLEDQAALLPRAYEMATQAVPKVVAKADLINFYWHLALHIQALARAALSLMESRQPYAVPLLARSAMESAFVLVAGHRDEAFGPQRMAYELEDLARKLDLMLTDKARDPSQRPTPQECRDAAERIRREYNAPAPPTRGERDRIAKIERVAAVAGLEAFYDDEYRQLSLPVHANLAGIVNAGSGFLVCKGMVVLCNAVHFATSVLCNQFRLGPPLETDMRALFVRMEALMKQPQFLP
jgi:hypothetical protein